MGLISPNSSTDEVAAAALPPRHLVVLGGNVEALDGEVATLGNASDAPVVLAPLLGDRLVARKGLRHLEAARAEPVDQRLGLEHGGPARPQRRPDAIEHAPPHNPGGECGQSHHDRQAPAAATVNR
ncbi:MAG: hypothetical protein U1E52_21605 [Geminicoccaceae bacterium]